MKRVEYATFLLVGLLGGLVAYAVAFIGWYAAFWWANHPEFPASCFGGVA